MFNRVEKNPRSESSGASVTKPKQGRERLQHFADEIVRAHNAIEDLEQRVARFGAIITESEVTHRALQDAINADGGIALAAYSAGQTKPNDAISKLVSHAKSSGEAAAAAKTALPHTESLLENARSQLISLVEQKNAELNRVVATLADVDARKYQEAFALLGKYHDRLVGYAAMAEGNQGDVRLIQDPLKTVRFALPSMGNMDADPFLRHQISDLTVGESARKWSEVRHRLQSDANADLTDLVV
jgi:type VI protein secretion system component VasK